MDNEPHVGAPLDPEAAVAVIGMAAHFPGAEDVRQFWSNLRGGVESVRRFSDEELEVAGVDPSLLRNPRYVKANAVLQQMEWFDAGFFGMSPRDAAIMDPQTRHFLECVWHALEHSGYVPERFDGNIGIFAGAGAAQYFWKNVIADAELRRTVGYFLLRHTGNDKDFVATRASYEFDLSGPSVGIQTACSTSLVAIHYACQSLLGWECDMALAGGVTIEQPHLTGYLYEEGEILSPDGHCRSFDSEAGGTVFGSGAGVVVLRRLADALEAGDTVHAVVRGTAVNNDGAGKVSYLAPSVDGQAKAIAEALSLSGVNPETIGLVEAHGTATPVGDPIEVAALTQAFRAHTAKRGFCALGSVKSNIGHLDTAAGVASFIKAVQSIEHGEIPPTVHFEKPNPLLELDSSPFYVNGELRPWPDTGSPRRAGVSSLGVGGTNAHVVVEEAPRATPSGPSRDWQLLTLSGRSSTVLEDASRDLLDFLDGSPEADLADVSYTLRNGRRRFAHRRALVCASREDAVEALVTGQAPGLTNGVTEAERRDVAFLFAGGGAQYPNMGRELYEREPVFKEAVDRCLDHFESLGDFDLRAVLFPSAGAEEEAAEALLSPSRALPALFTVQFAQARSWMSWGVRPSAMIGHSMGEYTAACLAGVFSPEDALALVYERATLFETLERGAMLSVSLAEADLRPYLVASLSIAAVNAPDVSVAAGPVGDIEALERTLVEADVDCRRIRIDVAAHSSMLDPILPAFEAYLETMELSPPEVTVVSNLTGRAAGEEMTRPDYWVRHLRETVRFSEGLGGLIGPEGPVLLEVGPGRTLATLARLQAGWTPDQPVLHSLPHPGERADAQAFQISTLGALWVHGVDPDWAGFDGDEDRRRIPLPGYPFEREPYFVPPPGEPEVPSTGTDREADSSRPRREDLSEWFYQTEWVPTTLPTTAPPATGSKPDPGETITLVLTDPETPGDRLAARCERRGSPVVRARRGSTFEADAPDHYMLRPGSPDDWKALFTSLKRADRLPDRVVHAWCLGPSDEDRTRASLHDDAFFGPLWMLQALEEVEPGHRLRFVAVTSAGVAVTGDESVEPHRALLQGPVRVAGHELPSVETRLVDLGSLPEDPVREARALARLAAEIGHASSDTIVAYRGPDRLAERFAPVALPEGVAGRGLREGGAYLITGGLGGLGLVVAAELAESAGARIALLGRTGLPQGAERASWLDSHPADDKTSRAIREVERLERLGAEVLVLAADVTDVEQVKHAIGETIRRFGGLNGVIHAAGVLDDGPLLGRTADQVHSVMDAKVEGVEALAGALDGVDLDLLLLFSSVSAVIGAPGQIDYTAANAYLDAFARSRAEVADYRVVSLAWGAWRDVGMAAELAGETTYGRDVTEGEVTAVDHPLFDVSIETAQGAMGFRMRFSVGRHWMVDEHRLRDGAYILPGSGYVELIRAAYARVAPGAPFAMDGLVFLKPFRVEPGRDRELQILLTPRDTGWDVVVSGRSGPTDIWEEHATAYVAPTGLNGESWEELPALLDRVGRPEREDRPPHPFMDFGPRWSNVAASKSRDDEALLEHSLPPEFASDLTEAALHPALLDMATAGAQHLVTGLDPSTDFLIPAGYGRLRMQAPLGRELTSHVRLRQADHHSGLVSFDVTIYDSDGRVAVDVRDFSMVRVRGDSVAGSVSSDGRPDWLRDAIAPEEGLDVLRRVLTNPTGPHVLVATRPLNRLVEDAGKAAVRPAGRTVARRAPQRVPMSEVSEALETHEAVKEAAALGTREEGESARVVAFVVYESRTHATVSELRRFVRKIVGPELTPQNFVEMIGLPRDDDGSVRFDDLRDPFAAVDDHVAPRTATETTIASIWTELLGLGRVGIHDNFLDVGGHSLVGIRVLSRIHKETGVRLEANALTLQTLEQLAADVDRTAAGSSSG